MSRPTYDELAAMIAWVATEPERCPVCRYGRNAKDEPLDHFDGCQLAELRARLQGLS